MRRNLTPSEFELACFDSMHSRAVQSAKDLQKMSERLRWKMHHILHGTESYSQSSSAGPHVTFEGNHWRPAWSRYHFVVEREADQGDIQHDASLEMRHPLQKLMDFNWDELRSARTNLIKQSVVVCLTGVGFWSGGSNRWQMASHFSSSTWVAGHTRQVGCDHSVCLLSCFLKGEPVNKDS